MGILLRPNGMAYKDPQTGEYKNISIVGGQVSITDVKTEYQVSESGNTVPTGTWQDSIPTVPQAHYLWSRVTLTWNGDQQTTLYSVARHGLDGSGSVSAVNGYSPGPDGNVIVPVDAAPTDGSGNPVSSDGVFAALADKQDALTFDDAPTAGSENPLTSDGINTALDSSNACDAIVANGDTAPRAISLGQYVIWKGAAYKSRADIANGATLSSANLESLPNGIGNDLLAPITANITFGAGVGIGDSRFPVSVKKFGKLVVINAAVLLTDGSTFSTTYRQLFSLPSGFAPSYRMMVSAIFGVDNIWQSVSTASGKIQINESDVSAYCPSTTTNANYVQFTASYFVD